MTSTGGGQNERLEQLIYLSESVSPVASALAMSDILAVARPNNARDDITGALTATNGRFIQIVEGPAAALDDLMRRLASDTRHRVIEVLERRSVAARGFPTWDMVSPRLMAEEMTALDALMASEGAGLDDYIPVFTRALKRQEELLAR